MNTIYAKYNMYHNSIDIYTSAGYMLRIDCNKAEDGLKPLPAHSIRYMHLLLSNGAVESIICLPITFSISK